MIEGIRWFKQSAFLWEARGVYIDPYGIPSGAPRANAILITHAHGDHFSLPDIEKIAGENTIFVAPLDVAETLQDTAGTIIVVSPGDAFEILGFPIDAVPAYNVHPDRLGFHPAEKQWVGYVFTLDGTRYYHAGDTDLIPDMEPLSCEVALLPIGGTYTMDTAEAAEAARKISPRVVVPMHYGFKVGSPSDAKALDGLLSGIEVLALDPEAPFERS